MMDKLSYNVLKVVDTTEVDLDLYPSGSATVPPDKYRKVYAIVLSNNAGATNTLTLKIYRGTTLEASLPITLGASSALNVVGNVDNPILVLPPNRTLRAVASSSSVSVLMAMVDE